MAIEVVNPATSPLVVAIEMGYGHLRPAKALGDYLSAEVMHADRPPLADVQEQKLWHRLRQAYELTSRASQLGNLGAPLRSLLESVTEIPHLYPQRDLSAPTVPARLIARLARRGLGRGLVDMLQRTGAPLLTTFYAPALLADIHGYDKVFCVVTDVDVNRVWAAVAPERSKIVYLVPGERTRRRLLAYGVRKENIHVTGFPLPHELVGGEDLPVLRRNLAGRLARLDPSRVFQTSHGYEIEHFLGPLPRPRDEEPPRLTFAVGGAGAQVGLVEEFLPSLWGALTGNRLRLDLVAGLRPEVAARFHEALDRAKLSRLVGENVRVHLAHDFASYTTQFNSLIGETDILWTKPSELAFFAALGVPLVMSWPMGVHERYNRRFVIESGAGIKQHEPRHAGEWLFELLHDGVLARAAWSGFMQLPKFGLYRIAEILRRS